VHGVALLPEGARETGAEEVVGDDDEQAVGEHGTAQDPLGGLNAA